MCENSIEKNTIRNDQLEPKNSCNDCRISETKIQASEGFFLKTEH